MVCYTNVYLSMSREWNKERRAAASTRKHCLFGQFPSPVSLPCNPRSSELSERTKNWVHLIAHPFLTFRWACDTNWNLLPPFWRARFSPCHQEVTKIGDLDGMPSRHPPKIVGVVSECQESRSVSTKFANGRTLYQASRSEIIDRELLKSRADSK